MSKKLEREAWKKEQNTSRLLLHKEANCRACGDYVNYGGKATSQEERSGNCRRARRSKTFCCRNCYCSRPTLDLPGNTPAQPLRSANPFLQGTHCGRVPAERNPQLCSPPGSASTRRKPTFLLHGIGDGFLDPSGPHDGRIRVGIVRHGH